MCDQAVTIILKLCDTCGGYGEKLCDLISTYCNYEIVILDTSPSQHRRARHVRTASLVEKDVNFVYTGLMDAIEAASGDYIAILDLDELPEKPMAVRREYINLEEL